MKSTSKNKKPIVTDPSLKGRSALVNLTKEQIIETILAQTKLCAAVHTLPLLARRPTIRHAMFAERGVAYLDKRAKELAQLSKADLVELAYQMADDRLNTLNPGSRHKTTPTERRQDVLKRSFTLRRERALELNPHWARQWKKRDKATYNANIEKVAKRAAKAQRDELLGRKKRTTVKVTRPAMTRRETKKATKNWISQMKHHNSYLTSQVEPTFHSVEI